MNRKVVITGVGTVSPFGVGKEIFWESLRAGKSAARPIESFDASALPVRFWANVSLTDRELQSKLNHRKAAKLLTRAGKMSMIAAAEAAAQSGLDFPNLNPFRTGVSVGASGGGANDLGEAPLDYSSFRRMAAAGYADLSEAEFRKTVLENTHPLLPLKSIPNSIAAHLSITYRAQAVSQTITTACTSSSQAVGEAFHKIKHGLCDVMLTGGADSVTNPDGMSAFSLLGVLSKRNDDYQTASRPFDRDRDGFMAGEGATFFVLEAEEHCKKRGGEILAYLTGYGCTADAYRITDEPEDANGAVAAIKQAVTEAEIAPENLSYINAHGTGTRMNDPTETYALKQVLGAAAYKIPVSSNKSMFGHLVAGAGAIELAASVLSLQNQVIPPTINLQNPDEKCDLDYVPHTARDAKLRHILSNSFGFGGQNSCLVISV